MFDYPVILEEDDGTFLATFVDLPGATFGETRQEALDRAVDALESVLMALIVDRKDVPNASAAEGRPTVSPSLRGRFKLALYAAMRARGWKKADLARALDATPRTVDRLLDLEHGSTIDQLEAALAVCGWRADVSMHALEAA